MPRNLIRLAAVLLPMSLFAQNKDLPTFGKISKADLQLTSCDFDKDAEAEVLSDVGRFYFDFRASIPYQELHRHVRIKILNDKGLKHADIKLRYHDYRNDEYITNLAATTYNLDAGGNIVATKLDKKLIYDKRESKEYSVQSFTMPEAKAGSVIEYEYTMRGARLREWYLQQRLPIKLSYYEVDFPAEIDLHMRPICSLPFKADDHSTNSRTIKNITMRDIPGMRDENYVTTEKDYLQRIEAWVVGYTVNGRRTVLLKSWQENAQLLLDDEQFGLQLKKSIPHTAELDEALKKTADKVQRMMLVHEYVKKNMSWDGTESWWSSNGVKAAWKEKKGTSGEINLILINLLDDAGIDAHPMLVSTHDNGRVSTGFPDYSQFNKVMAVVVINDREYILDATDKYTPVDLIPEDVLYTDAMVLDARNPYKFRWDLLGDSTNMISNLIIFQAAITASGTMKGHARVSSGDYARIQRTRSLAAGKDKFLDKFYLSEHKDLQIDSLNIENEMVDTLSLVQNFDFQKPVASSGDYTYFSANLFTGMKNNPFIADSRFSDIFFGTRQSHTIIANIKIPAGYEFEELPKNIKMTLEDHSMVVTRMVTASNGVLNAKIVLEYKRPMYSVEEYGAVKEFYKKMYSLLDEQFVIRKKA